jgi:hypothetical protein
VAMRIIAHPAMISIAANDPRGGGSRTAATHGAPLPATIRHTLCIGSIAAPGQKYGILVAVVYKRF